MKPLSLLSLWLLTALGGLAQTGMPAPTMNHCDQAVEAFLNTYDIPGATLAVAKDGELVYARAFGHADLAGNEPTQPHHLFRIASVSKPITSLAVMKLIEKQAFSLSSQVFGPGGLLEAHPYLSQVSYTDLRLEDITVQHLLEHTAGWNRDVDCVEEPATPYGYAISHCDPIGFPLHVTHLLGESNPVREEVLIRFLMEEGLDFAPGTGYAYSNIGYLVLGEIIAQVSGQSYEAYVQQEILAPLGICDMHIGKNLKAEQARREAEYQGNGFQTLSCYGTGNQVPWEYGGFNLEAMGAHGGWIATARDLLRLLSAVDGFGTRPDILSSATLNTMTTVSNQNGTYAKGWSINQFGNWWHTGALDGSASIWVRSSGGYLWAFITNKRIIDSQANQFWSDFDDLPWNCVQNTSTWPDHDLFDLPGASSGLTMESGLAAGSAALRWNSGSGQGRILVGRADQPVELVPLDGSSYSPNHAFGQGEDLGDGHFVLFQGNGDRVMVTELDSTRTYHFELFEYNLVGPDNLPLYQLCSAPVGSLNLSTPTGVETSPALGLRCFPNPGRDQVQLRWDATTSIDALELRAMQGQVLRRLPVNGTSHRLDTRALAAGLYLISAFGQGQYLGSQRWVKQ